MRRVTARHLLLTGYAALLLLGCQPSEPIRDPSGAHYPRVGDGPALAPQMSQATLPDFAQIDDVAAKKSAFFGFLRPLVEHQNQHMLTLRKHLLRLDQAFNEQGGLHPDDRRWLSETAALFRVDSDDSADQLRRLKRKVGQIPTAMVLAQAANESAWGTSRFARQGNNLFGMWCFTPGCGLEPLQRSEGATHEVEAYASVEEGIYRYLINLNANSSYRDMRRIRQCLREQQKPASGRALSAGLTGYSERGNHYVEELRAMIRINQLEPWAANWWGKAAPKHPCYALVQVVIDAPDPIAVPDAEPAGSAATPSPASAAQPSAAVTTPTAAASSAAPGMRPATPAVQASAASASAATAAKAAKARPAPMMSAAAEPPGTLARSAASPSVAVPSAVAQ